MDLVEDIDMWRIIIGGVGIVTIWVSSSFWWKTVGIMLLLVVTMIPKNKNKFRKMK